VLWYFTRESRCTSISSRVERNITCAAGVGQNRTRSRCRAWGGDEERYNQAKPELSADVELLHPYDRGAAPFDPAVSL
jgi:hypothetical protein